MSMIATATVAAVGAVGGGFNYLGARENASATRDASAAQAAGAVESAKIYTAAAAEAARLAEIAAQTRRAEDIAAANDAAAKSEQYLMESIPQMQAARQAGVDFTNTEFAAAYDTINKAYQPYIETGNQADQRLNALNFGTPDEAKNALTMDPGYQFRLDQGQKALERSQIGRGNLLSGAAATEMQNYGQGMASDEFSKAYNRLMGLSTRGQGAKGTVSANQLAMAGTRAQGAQSMAGLGEQNARDIANVRTTGAENVLRATMGGNQSVQGAVTSGAGGVARATQYGQQGIQNALVAGSNMNLAAQVGQNNALYSIPGNALYQGAQAYGYFRRNPPSPSYQSNYANGYAPTMETGQWDNITGIYTP